MSSDTTGRDQLPSVKTLGGLILTALQQAEGAVTVGEMLDAVARALKLTDEQLAIPHDSRRGQRSELSYRMAWARTDLRANGLIDRAEHGRWTLTKTT
jgi:restriction system protein